MKTKLHCLSNQNKNRVFLLSRLKDIDILLHVKSEVFPVTLHNHNYWSYHQTTIKQNKYFSSIIRLLNHPVEIRIF